MSALKIIVVIGAIWLGLRLLRRIDWGQVGDALTHMSAWQLGVVLILVAVRQTVSALPLYSLIPELSFPRAVQNALSANLITTVAPPPAELFLRLSMFKTWGVDATRGVAGTVLNTFTVYVVRFAAPVVGLIISFFLFSPGADYIWPATLGGVVAAVLIGGLAMVARAERLAATIGRKGGAFVHRFKASVNGEDWSAKLARFQRESTDGLGKRGSEAFLGMLAFAVVDGSMVVVCLRFVGVPASEVSYAAVLAAFLCVYTLTILPFAGLGVLDASLISLLSVHTDVDQATMVAAMVVWRTATLLVPMVPGLVAFGLWKRRYPASGAGDATATAVPPADRPADATGPR
ncbi:UPF0104 family protein [Nakamurella silvestris]|nr:UPF0104 family protein [Nakamurella silvestris]